MSTGSLREPAGAADAADAAGDAAIRRAGRSGAQPDGPDEAAEKAASVRRMFGGVAPRYDLLNHLLSLNIDRGWRRKAIDALLALADPAGVILDSCAGTLDLSAELTRRPAFRGRIVACDFALPMLLHGASKVVGRPVGVSCADALCLPLASGSVDGAMVGFGVRNLASLDVGLAEFARVLRPGAPLVILEFMTPRRQPLRAAYLFYFRRVLPMIGRLVSGHGSAYAYLPDSVVRFPPPHELAARIGRAGFSDCSWTSLTGGIAAIHTAVRG
jgi:demethylmenaquinone methyltransferase/2-methoxy-6-polyprenyl-1,4-benzoquinol methylase